MTEEEWIALQTGIVQPDALPATQPGVAQVAQQQVDAAKKAQEDQDKLQQLQTLYYPEPDERGLTPLQPGRPEPNPWWEPVQQGQQLLPDSARRYSTGGYIYA